MTLPREDVSNGLVAELANFEALLRTIDDSEWSKPSRCEGWNVSGVASHAIGGIADVVNGRLDGLGSPEVTQREVDERAGKSPKDLANEAAQVRQQAADTLALFDDAAWETPAPGGNDGTLGDGVEALWFDLYMHAEDIRSALGRPSERGDGRRLDGDPLPFVLAATGRDAPSKLGLDPSVNLYG
jgi:uncharacterized protein (TIGR03083 family)